MEGEEPSPKLHEKETSPEQFVAVAVALKETAVSGLATKGTDAEQVRLQGGVSVIEIIPSFVQVTP